MNIGKYIIAFGAVATLGLASCNNDNTIITDDQSFENSNVLIRSFNLKENNNVCANLNNVYFTIDLKTGDIFNADSLPYNSPINKLSPSLKYAEDATIQFYVPKPAAMDSIISYDDDSDIELDFTNGPIKIRVTSASGHFVRDYKVQVNVHQSIPDTIMWKDLAIAEGLPGGLDKVTEQRTTKSDGKAYCLVTDGSKYAISNTDNPNTLSWVTVTPTFGFNPEIGSFTGTEDALYIRDKETGFMYKSTDSGKNWKDTGLKVLSIFGSFGNNVLTLTESEGNFSIFNYPENKSCPMPEGFPVYGSSSPIEFSPKWGDTKQIVIAGGMKRDGTLSDTAWGYDGSNWINLSSKPMPHALMSPVVVPYFLLKYGSYWTTTSFDILMLYGGHYSNGVPNDTIYLSLDYGMSWRKAESYMQLPEGVPALYNAQGLVFDSELKVPEKDNTGETPDVMSKNIGWKHIVPNPIPVTARPLDMPWSRLTKPVSEWNCPYIFVFGGIDKNGKLSNTIWRGVLNKFTFIPIQ